MAINWSQTTLFWINPYYGFPMFSHFPLSFVVESDIHRHEILLAPAASLYVTAKELRGCQFAAGLEIHMHMINTYIHECFYIYITIYNNIYIYNIYIYRYNYI